MANLALVFDLLARDKASATLKHVGDQVQRTGKLSTGLGKVFKGLAVAVGGLLVFDKVARAIGGFVKDAAESVRVGRLTDAVLKSTGGAAHVTAGHVSDLATAISNKTGIDDEAIQSNENLLLTFTNIQNRVGKGNKIFDQATLAVSDMSAALGQSGKSSAIQLGKALNDPIKGVTALQRVGVSFTQSQKDQIATLVKSGDVLGAQKVILKEVGKEFGGAAAAAASPLDKLKVIAGNLGEQFGGILLPHLNKFATWLAKVGAPAISKFLDWLGPKFDAAIKFLTPVLKKLGDFLGNVFSGKWDKVRAQLGEWGSKIVDWIQNTAAPWIWEKLKLLGAALVDWIKPRIPGMIEKLKEWGGKAADWIQNTAAPWVWGKLKLLGAKLEAWIRPRIPGMLAKLQEFANKIGAWIVNKGLPMLGGWLGKMGAKLQAWIVPRIPGMIANLVKFGLAINNWILTKAIPMLISGGLKMAGRFISSFYNEAKRLDLPGKVKALITDMWNRAKAKLVEVAGGMKAKGRDIINGLLSGMKAPFQALKTWVSGIATWIKAHKGPLSLDSTLLAPAGKALMGGLLHGLKIGFQGVGDFIFGVSGTIKDVIGKIGSSLVIGAGNVIFGHLPTGGNRAIGRVMAAAYGWTGGQWNALNALWTGESGWNNRARNPSSGAFGIPQALPPGKMGAAAAGGNAAAQIAWGLRYIKQVYGSPANAYSKWQARSPHWYGSGTMGALPGLAGLAEKGAELVVSPQIRNMGGGGQRVFNARETEALLNGKRPIQITNNFPTTMSPETAAAAAGGRILAALAAMGG